MFDDNPLFAGIEPARLECLAERFTVKRFPKNAVIITEGDESDTFYMVVSGRVKVYLSDEEGREVIITIQGAGFYFGELAQLGHLRRSASVMTVEPSQLALLGGAEFMQILSENADIAINLIRELAHRLRETTDSLRGFALLDVYGRLTKLLLDLAREDDEGQLVIQNPPTQQTLARMVGASREMVGRILRELRVGGYIHTESKRLVIQRNLPAGW